MGGGALLWLTWSMRVVASGNLTVELIRAQRFDVAYRAQAPAEQAAVTRACDAHRQDKEHRPIDRVELSPEAMGSDPWAAPTDKAVDRLDPALDDARASLSHEVDPAPRRLSPVLGSPALAGLGAAWVVPGTLLDVVA